MEAEEFFESDILFPENLVHEEEPVVFQGHLNSENSRSTKPEMRERKKKKKKKNSNPINFPENISVNSIQSVESDLFDVDELVPPHVILDRRVSDQKMAFPVLTGKGRTLKGRDLVQFRDSVLRMTGFLEGNVTPQQF